MVKLDYTRAMQSILDRLVQCSEEITNIYYVIKIKRLLFTA